MSAPFASTLSNLIRLRGVVGSLLISQTDGIVVDSHLQVGVRGDVVAALVASLYRKASLASRAARLGETQFLQLEAENGRICALGHGDLVLVAVAEQRANVGLIRVEMLKALESIT